MKYVEITKKDACAYCRKTLGTKNLITVRNPSIAKNIPIEEGVIPFDKADTEFCIDIINQADKIINGCDGFIHLLKILKQVHNSYKEIATILLR